MKKLILTLVCAAMAALLSISCFATVNVAAPEAFDIKVDGIREDSYGEPADINSPRNGSSEDGASGKLWAAWSGNTIYYYVEIYDYTPFHEATNDYERDSFETYFNLSGDPELATFNTDDGSYIQIRFWSQPAEGSDVWFWGNNGGDAWTFDEAVKAGFTYVIQPLAGDNLDGGYKIEFSFDTSVVKAQTLGSSYPMDCAINDNINGTGREGHKFMEVADDNDAQYNVPTACNGIMTLVAAPEPEPVVEEVVIEEPVVEEAPAAEAAPVVTVAAQTFDAVTITAAAMLIAACGIVVGKKK